MPKDPKGPHSRACGVKVHQHGTDCHSNCPTCGGKPVATPSDGLPVVFSGQEHLRAYDSALLVSFAEWVASNRAYNGAPDPGQSLYNEQINAVLVTWAKEFAEERQTGGKHRAKVAGDWPEGDDRLCTMLSCWKGAPHDHGGETVFEGHRRYTERWIR